MPELPDVTVYSEHIERRKLGKVLQRVRLNSPFVLRTVLPPLAAVENRKVTGVRRVGKRIVLGLENGLYVVIHLMIAGRLHWADSGKPPGRRPLALFEFENGVLSLTEAGTKRRASIHIVEGEPALKQMDPGGFDVAQVDPETFVGLLKRENHTLKRSLTDPHLFSGIGNAYSDEILHRARLSPIAMTQSLSKEETSRLLSASREVLSRWTELLRREAGDEFPEKVTAFREGFAVHGKFGKPCPVCGAPVQRIVYAENETNYCARCQTGGRILADRALSRLLKKSWPKSINELE
jgi:formamidopyrimidine-DNA glycosylase